MPLPVLPSKLVWERVRVEFDFSDQLEFNEAISSWIVEVSVQTGEDSNPDDLIATRRFLDGNKVYQWIINGLPGVVYRLTATVIGSSSKTYKLEKTLAILPCQEVAPPLFGITYTTTLYPLQVIESLDAVVYMIGGALDTPPRITESMDIVVDLLGGELKTPVVFYSMLPEALDILPALTGGDLRTPLVSYSIQPEALDIVAVVLNGTLKLVLVSYLNYIPEAFNVSAEMTGGSLV